MSLLSTKTDPLSTVYDDEVYALGTIYIESSEEVEANLTGVSSDVTASNWMGTGNRTWIFVRAVGDVTKGRLLKFDYTTLFPRPGAPGVTIVGKAFPFHVTENTTSDQHPMQLAGVSDHDIPDGKYGWIIKQGVCFADVTTCSDGNGLAGDGTSGHLKFSSSPQLLVGIALEDKDKTVTDYAHVLLRLP
tara:strand:+ start:10402 stop:10968 length:567 start_codon:yes stop_codon:yes gene_type:complete